MEVKYPNIEVQLSDQDGNAMMIIGRVSKALRRAGVGVDEREAFTVEAKSGNYDHVLQTVMRWVLTS